MGKSSLVGKRMDDLLQYIIRQKYVDVTEGEEESGFEEQFVLSELVLRGFCEGLRQD